MFRPGFFLEDLQLSKGQTVQFSVSLLKDGKVSSHSSQVADGVNMVIVPQ